MRFTLFLDADSIAFSLLFLIDNSLNLSNYLVVKEYITYFPKLQNPESKVSTFSQRAIIDCVGFSTGLLAKAAKKLEDISFQRFGDNADKGRQGLMHVCRQLFGNADE